MSSSRWTREGGDGTWQNPGPAGRSTKKEEERALPAVMLVVFALTLFVSASLLFIVEPMVGKMMLPLLGGTPAVWNTCMLFFQAVLLAGYAYAHPTTGLLGLRRQALVHLGLLLLPFRVLPITVPGARPLSRASPIPVLAALLGTVVGL